MLSVHASTLETPYYLVHGRDPNVAINQILNFKKEPILSQSDYIGNLAERLRFSFTKAREENKKARVRQKEQYDKRAKALQYRVGDRVLLDIRVVKAGDCKKFTSKYKGPFRVVKTYKNFTCDIADSAHHTQRVHMNRLKPLLEAMVWTDETCPDLSQIKQ